MMLAQLVKPRRPARRMEALAMIKIERGFGRHGDELSDVASSANNTWLLSSHVTFQNVRMSKLVFVASLRRHQVPSALTLLALRCFQPRLRIEMRLSNPIHEQLP
ncbi:hypothetical protein K443DRAFT_413834 [Laccaria amethystina LaAM-08-1]|uniref:Uncharacterized protein n=1 Tax=Laccaria amethystina LaAM-08-1 TaxID=1095629 RepID=A0A0C9X9U4_9AGAR|nr:hypothetical protein K443DRAFT_413834 [Laccaria amethystina LaAM-08-1]